MCFIFSANQARGGSIFGQLPAYSNSSGRCLTAHFLRDDIVGNDRRFTAWLEVDNGTYPSGVTISNPSLTVFVQDTSKSLFNKPCTLYLQLPNYSSIAHKAWQLGSGVKTNWQELPYISMIFYSSYMSKYMRVVLEII